MHTIWLSGAVLVSILVIGGGMPGHAQNPVTGGGMYDFLIQTNCFVVRKQQDTGTPSWISDGTYPENRVPLLAAAPATGIVRTVDLPDQIAFFSSHPTVVVPPPKVQAVGAIGGVPYQPTNVPITVKSPRQPTDVTVTAQGSRTSVVGSAIQLGQPKRVERKFRVYPPQAFKSAVLAPVKTVPYTRGERLRIDLRLAWKIPFATTVVEVRLPTYTTTKGETRSAQLPEWKHGSGYVPKRLTVMPNTDQVAFEFAAPFPPDASAQKLGPAAVQTSLVVPIRLVSEAPACPGLAGNPRSSDVTVRVQQPLANLPARPTP